LISEYDSSYNNARLQIEVLRSGTSIWSRPRWN